MSVYFDKPRTFWIHFRMGIIGVLISGMFVAVIVRVYLLQTLQGEDLRRKADRQSSRKVKMKAKRGTVYDRNLAELAVSVEAPSIAVRPALVKDARKLAADLAPILDEDEDGLYKDLSSKKGFIWLARQTTPEIEGAILQLKAPGIEVHVESRRFYPMGTLAGQVLGFTNIDGNGLEGVERSYDKQLAGKEFEIEGVRDARGRTLFTGSLPELAKYGGQSVILTLDHRLQKLAEEELERAVKEFQAKAGYAVMLDVKTGEVLVMANTPGFNPNKFKQHVAKDWRLRSVTDTFEPGSVTKPLVLAAALQEKTIKLNSKIDTEEGRIKIGKYTIRDTHRSEVLTAAEVIQKSSNIGIYKIAQTMGRAKLYGYLRAFGFGARTSIGLYGEQPGVIWPYEKWAEVSFANIAFGQGFTATPLQIVASIAALGNQGILMKPQIIKGIRDHEGNEVETFQPVMVRHVVSKEVARQASWAISLVAREGGTGTRAALENVSIAAKTGTAQKVNPKTKRYDPDLWTGSVAGYVPAEKPEVAIFVMLDEPKVSHYGGVVTGDIFRKLAAEALRLRSSVPVAEEERFRFYDRQEKRERKRERAEEQALRQIQEEWVLPEVVLPPIAMEDDKSKMPDLLGMTLKEVVKRTREMGYLPKVHGWGRVVQQDPASGASMDAVDEIEVFLEPRPTHGDTSVDAVQVAHTEAANK